MNPTELLKSLKRSNYRLEWIHSEDENQSFDFEESVNSVDPNRGEYSIVQRKGTRRKSVIIEKGPIITV